MAHSECSVTIIIPAYNHDKYIVEALDSVARQTYKEFELIVIDDASSDATAHVADRWMSANPQVPSTLIRREINGGICAALNEAISQATGEILVTLASDDWLAPDHVERCVQAFSDHPAAVAVYSDLTCINEHGIVIHESWLRTLETWPPPQGAVYARILEANFVPAPGTAVCAGAVDQVGGYDEELLIEDYDMWLRLAQVGEFWWTGHSTVFYRSTTGSLTSRDPFGQTLSMVRTFGKHVAVPEPRISRLAMRRKMQYVKALHANAQSSQQKRVARRAMRKAMLERPSLSMLVFGLTAHVGIPYSWLASTVGRIRSLKVAVRGGGWRRRVP